MIQFNYKIFLIIQKKNSKMKKLPMKWQNFNTTNHDVDTYSDMTKKRKLYTKNIFKNMMNDYCSQRKYPLDEN